MGQGAVGAYGLAGLQDAIRQRLADQYKQRQIEQEMQLAERRQRLAEQELEMRGKEHQMGLQNSKDLREWQQHVFDVNEGRQFNESIPGGTTMSATNPIVGQLRMGGAQLTDKGFAAQEPPEGIAGLDNGPVRDLPGTIQSSPMMSGRLVMKGASANQANTLADNARADAANASAHEDRVNARTDRADAQTQAAADRENLARLVASMRAAPAGDRSRTDHSYDTQTKRLDTLEKPLADQAERIGRLRATINQNTPQADALIAPELLTAMAGGAGSGLRMNEAEIARIIGGRNQWESLKARLNAWQADPSKPFAVTPEQRTQMRTLVAAIADRGQRRLKLIDDARVALSDAPDVAEHRRIADAVRKALNADTMGDESGSGGAVEEWTRDASGKLVRKGPR